MRLQGIEKLGFYPTPPISLQYIASYIQADTSARLYDPCAGEGEALAYLARHLREQGARPETYGVEISYARAAKAKEVLDHLLETDVEDIAMTDASMSLLWLNPPYDTEAVLQTGEQKKHRLEYRFLQRCLPKLQPGGLLVYIVPIHIVNHKLYASYIWNHLTNIRVYRLPGGEFDQFKQVVLFGYRHRHKDRIIPPTFTIEEPDPPYISSSQQPQYIPFLELPEETTARYRVPAPLINKAINFYRYHLSDDEVIALVSDHGAHTSKQWLQLNTPEDNSAFAPVVPLKVGHIAGLISSGQMGTVNLGTVLAKGRTTKMHEEVKRSVDDKGHVTSITERDKFETVITTLDRDGNIDSIRQADKLQEFMENYGEEIGITVSQTYKPMYQAPQEDEWRALAPLMKAKRVPGRKELGLFVAQKHCAIAMNRALDRLGSVTLVGEMGTGKTAVSLATAHLRNQWPVLVMCPTHLVDKWAEEVGKVVPNAKGIAINNLEEMQAFHERYEEGQRKVAVISKETAKLGGGWRHAYITRKRTVGYVTADGRTIRFKANVVACPKCGKIQRTKEKDGDLLFAPDQDLSEELTANMTMLGRNRISCTAPKAKWKGHPTENSDQGTEIVRDENGDPYLCGEPLWQVDGFRRWPVADYVHDKMHGFFKLFIADEVHEYKGKSTHQAQAYHQMIDACPNTINLTGTIFNGKSTSLFWILYRNDTHVRQRYDFNDEEAWAITYGRHERTIEQDERADDQAYSTKGKSRNRAKEIPGISPAIYGRLLPNTIFLKKSDLGWTLPPYSEEIVRVNMSHNQAEQYHWAIGKLWNRLEAAMKSWDKGSKKLAMRILSVWYTRGLGRPNSAFRREMVVWKAEQGDEHHTPYDVDEIQDFEKDDGDRLDFPIGDTDPDLPTEDIYHSQLYQEARSALYEADSIHDEPLIVDRIVAEDCILPKERTLLDLCVKEHDAGNKTIVFMNQTGTRNIQPRLERILKTAQLSAVTLPATVSARTRNTWIQRHAKDIDVMLCNPEAVKTGLDLVQFNRIIFFEPTPNLMTMQQSMNRIYRIGQSRDTKIYFLIYRDTMEEKTLALLRDKIRAAALLYGENAASAIVEEDGGDDIRSQLADRIAAGDKLTVDGIKGIMYDIVDDDSQTAWDGYENFEEEHGDDEGEAQVEVLEGYYYDPSRDFTKVDIRAAWDAWLSNQLEAAGETVEVAKKPTRKKVKVNESQLTLF